MEPGALVQLFLLVSFSSERAVAMKKSEELRKEAERCEEQAGNAPGEMQRARFRSMANSWTSLAKTQDWLEGELPQRTEDGGQQQGSGDS